MFPLVVPPLIVQMGAVSGHPSQPTASVNSGLLALPAPDIPHKKAPLNGPSVAYISTPLYRVHYSSSHLTKETQAQRILEHFRHASSSAPVVLFIINIRLNSFKSYIFIFLKSLLIKFSSL